MKIQDLKKPTDFLKYYRKYYNFNLVCSFHSSNRATWVNFNFPTKEFYDYQKKTKQQPNHRMIFPDELVIDIDSLSAKRYAKKIKERMYKKGLSYSMWSTGSSQGIHFHLFFSELMKFKSYQDRQLIKSELLKDICYGFLTKAHIENPYKIDFQMTGRHNVRLEKGLYEKNKSGNIKDLIEYNDRGKNLVPNEILAKAKKTLEKFKHKVSTGKFESDKDDPMFIKYLESEEFIGLRDGRKRVLFGLASWYKKRMKPEDALNKLFEYNKIKLHGYLRESFIISQFKCANGTVGESFFKRLLDELGKGYIIDEEESTNK